MTHEGRVWTEADETGGGQPVEQRRGQGLGPLAHIANRAAVVVVVAKHVVDGPLERRSQQLQVALEAVRFADVTPEKERFGFRLRETFAELSGPASLRKFRWMSVAQASFMASGSGECEPRPSYAPPNALNRTGNFGDQIR